ncbi:MAG: hypothetical protein KGL39_23905 [Patescibacteria group bacterium]|nr:hypothetical protein [Patescibacteria group bacterium]
MKKLAIVLFALLINFAHAQTGKPVTQSGTVTGNHPAKWVTNGVIGDGGTAASALLGSIGILAQGPGFCQYTGPFSGAYERMCLGIAANGVTTLSMNAFNGATTPSLIFSLNGTNYSFPYTVGGIVGPVITTVGHLAVWNNTVGSLLADSTALPNGTTGTTQIVSDNSTKIATDAFVKNNAVTLSITRAQIASTTIPVTSFIASGYAAQGDYGAGCIYTNQGATSGSPGAIQDAASTWFQIVSNGVFDVHCFGATGDGLTDDTTAILNTIAAMPATGGELKFPPGHYVTTGGFTISVATAVHGAGQCSDNASKFVTRIDDTSATSVLFTITADVASFQNICLINTSGAASAGSAILTNGTNQLQHVDIDNLDVSAFYDNVDIKVGAQWAIIHMHNENFIRYGIRIRNTVNADAGDWTLSHSYFAGAGGSTAAIRYESSGGGKIIANKINGSSAAGIEMNVSGSAQTVISNNDIENVNIPINITQGWPYIIIVDNYLLASVSGPSIVLNGNGPQYIGGGYMAPASAYTHAIVPTLASNLTTIGPIELNGYDDAVDPQVTNTYNIRNIADFKPEYNIYVGPLDPRLPGYTFPAYAGANIAYSTPFKVQRITKVDKVTIGIGMQSGNIDIGIYQVIGGTISKIASTGSTATPASGIDTINLTAAVLLYPGNIYYSAFSADNNTLTVLSSVATNGSHSMTTPYFPSGTSTTSFPLPTTMGTITPNAAMPVLVYIPVSGYE